MKTKIFALLLCCIGIAACEKNLDMEFNSTAPRYAVQGWLTPRETYVRISMTKDLDDTSSISDIANAIVTITDNNDCVYTIPYDTVSHKGEYASNIITGEPGNTYRLDVTVDGHHFSSTSTMYSAASINSFRLIWRKLMSERYIFGDVRIQDIPNEVNYYYIHIYRNDIPYRSAVLKDDTNPGKELQQLFAFNKENSTEWDTLKDGDILEVHVRSIDKQSYDYLYSVLQMDNTGTNPINNFIGGCLGYFSAFSITAVKIEYHTSDIEEEE